MHLRVYYSKRGGHIHCRVFSAKAKNLTFAKNGTLVFNVDEWPVIYEVLNGIAEMIEKEWQD